MLLRWAAVAANVENMVMLLEVRSKVVRTEQSSVGGDGISPPSTSNSHLYTRRLVQMRGVLRSVANKDGLIANLRYDGVDDDW